MTARKASASASATAKAKVKVKARTNTGVLRYAQDDDEKLAAATASAKTNTGILRYAQDDEPCGGLGDVGYQGFGGWGVKQGYYVLVVEEFFAVG
jgi:hypothetical protein